MIYIQLILIVLIFIVVFILIRNEWVYRKRVKILREDSDKFYRLEDYDEMMYRFWIWDVEKFIKE